ncbi:hypothetical protein [Nocardia wallacei]|uniref:hypothetical protein n=1 Tax=Nocardia wallacei TaxID=480035 RepID=UPI002458DACF|nr:hypothetical protein [Nocardia wallacei]
MVDPYRAGMSGPPPHPGHPVPQQMPWAPPPPAYPATPRTSRRSAATVVALVALISTVVADIAEPFVVSARRWPYDSDLSLVALAVAALTAVTGTVMLLVKDQPTARTLAGLGTGGLFLHAAIMLIGGSRGWSPDGGLEEALEGGRWLIVLAFLTNLAAVVALLLPVPSASPRPAPYRPTSPPPGVPPWPQGGPGPGAQPFPGAAQFPMPPNTLPPDAAGSPPTPPIPPS